MALLRRCAGLLYVRTRFIKFREKIELSLPGERYRGMRYYVHKLQINARSNSRHASADFNSRLKKTGEDELLGKQGMCYARAKAFLAASNDKKLSSDPSFTLRLLKNCRDMFPDATSKERCDLVGKTWNFVENLGQPLTTEHYNILLAIYAQNPRSLDADEFIRRMKAPPDVDTYRLLLEAIAESGDHVQASIVADKIEQMGHPLDEAIFDPLLLAYSIGGDVEGAQDVVARMEAASIEPGPATHCALARGFAAKGDIQSLRKILKTGNLSTKQLMAVVKTLSLSGHGENLSKVVEHLGKTSEAEDGEIRRVVAELIYSGKATDAFRVVELLPDRDPSDFFSFRDVVKSDTPTYDVLEICKSLASSGKNPSALLDVAEAALRSKKKEAALAAFQALRNNGVKIRPHFYWPLLVNAASNERESDVTRLVKRMIEEKVDPDYETLRNFVIPFLSVTEPVMLVRKLQDCGIKISKLLTPVLTFLMDNKQLDEAVALTNRIKGKTDVETMTEHLLSAFEVTRDSAATVKLLKNINFNSDQTGKFLSDLLSAGRVIVRNEELEPLVTALDTNRVKISRQGADALLPRVKRLQESEKVFRTVERLLDHKSNSMEDESYGRIPHPRVMTAEQLENHLLDLTAKGMNTRGVLRKLVQVYSTQNNLEKADKYRQIFNQKGFQWTAGMISGLFLLYMRNGLLDEADALYRELRSKHAYFKIDDHKIIDYATVLVNNERFPRALEVLIEQDVVRTSPEIIRNCWRFLNDVAVTTGDPEIIEKTLNLLIRKKYCVVNNHVLAPLIRTYLINGEIKAAVSKFKECASIYKIVTIPQELIRALLDVSVRTSEACQQINEIIDVVKDIHGEAAANEHMLTALAVKNRGQEFRKLITMPSIDQTTLNGVAQKLADEKNSDALIMILESCRDVDKLDTTIVCNLILTLCSRSNDPETALKLWEKMKTDKMNPSRRFTEDFKTLLKSQRIPLPLELR